MKTITQKFIKDLAEDAFESLMEGLHNNLFPADEWKIINDDTPIDDLPLYVVNEEYSPLTRLLAKQRLANKSVWDPELQTSLEKMIEDGDIGSNIPMDYDFGRLYVVYKLYSELGMHGDAKRVCAWAHWEPYN